MLFLRDYNKDKDSIKSFIEEYYEFDNYEINFPYQDQLKRLFEGVQNVVRINLGDVYEYDKELGSSIESNCIHYQKKFVEIIDEFLIQNFMAKVKDKFGSPSSHFQIDRLIGDSDGAEESSPLTVEQLQERFMMDVIRQYDVYFVGCTTAKIAAIRKLRGSEIDNISILKALVIGVTQQKASTRFAMYTCDKCGADAYQEVVDVPCLPLTLCQSKDCQREGNSGPGKWILQNRGSRHAVYQEVKVEELNGQIVGKRWPERIKVICHGQNTEKVHPGDHAIITGVMLPWATVGKSSAGLKLERNFDAHTLEVISKHEFGEGTNTEDDLNRLKDPDMYSLLARSIAPEIYDHEDIKKSILVMLAKGAKINYGGHRITGELNICLVGKLGWDRLGLLRFVDRLCPRSQFTTGRGTIGVGLTAAVTQDPTTHEILLEGGPLVLADESVCCIHELDKINETDQTRLYEVIEQQTISITEASIQAKLNARVSILAAADSAYNLYHMNKSLEENNNLPASLLSQFDMVWPISDGPDHTSNQKSTFRMVRSKETFMSWYMCIPELRRYLAIIQKQPDPKVPNSLVDYITAVNKAYVSPYQEASLAENVFSIPSKVQTVIKISTALARIHARPEVERSDVDEAIRLCESNKVNISRAFEK